MRRQIKFQIRFYQSIVEINYFDKATFPWNSTLIARDRNLKKGWIDTSPTWSIDINDIL